MAEHTQRILRNWKLDASSATAYSVFTVENIVAFFGAGTLIGASKWTAYGTLTGLMTRSGTGGYGQKIPFIISKAPNETTAVLVKGALVDSLSTSGEAFQFMDMDISSVNLRILSRAPANGETSRINITLDAIVVGNDSALA